MRFFAPVKKLSRPQLARLTQIDYDREMAFVCERGDDPEGLLGVVRLAADPDRAAADAEVEAGARESDCREKRSA